ncbi:TPR-like protein [Sparassis latifolia]
MSSPSEQSKTKAEELKIEGNALQRKGDYRGAHTKYSEAIKFNSENAILFANRAAASLSMKEFLDAAYDAQKATTLDRKFSKAWARLAKASHELCLYSKSIEAWKEALSCLPASNLSPVELKLKAQYEDGWRQVESAKSKIENQSPEDAGLAQLAIIPENMPWSRASSMEQDLVRNKTFSTSAWVIMAAYKEFSEGVQTMKRIRMVEPNRLEGTLGALADITNGLLRDDRVFHMDVNNWNELLHRQVQFECGVTNAWTTGGASIIQEEAPKRLKAGGWSAVRPALSNTVRTWVLQALFSSKGNVSHEHALSLYKSAISILEWGAKTWKYARTADRGVIFEKTFIRGVKRLRMEAYLAACKKCGLNSKSYTLRKLMDMAADILADVDGNPPCIQEDGLSYDAGSVLSFWYYPKASALAAMGFCQFELASQSKDDPEVAYAFWEESGDYYMQAAQCFPQDDEQFPYFLKVALETQWHRGLPLKKALETCAGIREGVTQAKKIWEHGAFWDIVEGNLARVQRFELEALTGLMDGRYTMDTPSSSIAFV